MGYRQLKSIRKWDTSWHFLRRKNLTHHHHQQHHHNPKKWHLAPRWRFQGGLFGLCIPTYHRSLFHKQNRPKTRHSRSNPVHPWSLIHFPYHNFCLNICNKLEQVKVETSMFHHHWISLVHSNNFESCLARVDNAWNHLAFAYLPYLSILLSVGSVPVVLKPWVCRNILEVQVFGYISQKMISR